MTAFAKATRLALLTGAVVMAASPSMAQDFRRGHARPLPGRAYHRPYPGWRGPGIPYGVLPYAGPAVVYAPYAYFGAPYPYPYPAPYPAPGPYPAPYADYDEDDYPANAPPPPPPPSTAAPAPQAQARRPASTKEFIVYFAFDGDQLPADAQQVVQDAVRYDRSIPGARVTVVGYTDAAGAEGYNQDLSQRRSETVRQALMASGVAKDAITMEWRGKHDLAVPTADGVREPDNRRVTIVVNTGSGTVASRNQASAGQR
jgi:outer membrane protein OmpA-like peptidoglycan-associated protein